MSYLGLDIGTGGCKAVIFDAEGKELTAAFKEYPLMHPSSGYAELDPDRVMQACFDVLKEVNNSTDDPVEAMSISSQGEAFTPVDVHGIALGNAMVSSDSRASDIVSGWSRAFGIEKIYGITGHTPHTLFTLYKILWIKAHQPDIWKKARYFLCFEDLFHFRMGLTPKISWPLAGRTMLFDVTRHTWSPSILEAAGLSAEKLALPVPSGEVCGTIPLQKGRELGFKKEVNLVAGGHDQPVAALGAGVIEAGMCMYATGSVECFCPVLEKPSLTPELQRNNLCCYDYTVKGRYTSVAYSLTGGNILRWMRDQLGQTEVAQAELHQQNAYTLLLDAMPSVPTDLLVLPYFSPTGTPYFDTTATGAILGLRLTTTKGEITRALLEGVALEMKLNLEIMEKSGMKIDTFVATGGGTRHPGWSQLKADVLHKEIRVLPITEAGCFGASLLARSAMEQVPVVELVKRNSAQSTVFCPDPRHAETYDRIFETYKSLYPGLKTLLSNN
ncbi:MAG: FGGY-family carbohydrate kinase [Bacteroidales bacterium]